MGPFYPHDIDLLENQDTKILKMNISSTECIIGKKLPLDTNELIILSLFQTIFEGKTYEAQ